MGRDMISRSVRISTAVEYEMEMTLPTWSIGFVHFPAALVSTTVDVKEVDDQYVPNIK